MAIRSKLQTIDGQYYATEKYVNDKVAEAAEKSQDIVNDSLSGVIEEINEKANSSDVYTKEEVANLLNTFYSFNTVSD